MSFDYTNSRAALRGSRMSCCWTIPSTRQRWKGGPFDAAKGLAIVGLTAGVMLTRSYLLHVSTAERV
jgi:hypothetical protein